MKRLLSLSVSVVTVAVCAQETRSVSSSVPQIPSKAYEAPERGVGLLKSRLLWVSTTGNDASAVAGLRNRPWKTVYDIFDTNGPACYGAVTAALPGDWIVFEPGTYYVPAIPLNLPGDRNRRGLNLLIPPGTTIIRTNFSNTNSVLLPANLDMCGPLIIPGEQSRVIVEGTVVATNGAIFDGVFGWASAISMYAPARSRLYGFSNWPAAGVVLEGHGTLSGSSDVIYISSVLGSGMGSLTCRNLHLRSRWDCVYSVGTNFIQTEAVDATSGIENVNRGSHGIVVLTYGNWVDYQSSFTATGASLPGIPGDQNAAAYVATHSTIRLQGTRLIGKGSTNVVPFFSSDSICSGWYWQYTYGNPRPKRVVFELFPQLPGRLGTPLADSM